MILKIYVLLLAFLMVGCEEKQEVGSSPNYSKANDTNVSKKVEPISKAEIGIASYYADIFHGKPTASGEPYDRDAFTAAHPTLAFGTRVRVTEVANGKSVIVTINDRGPHTKSRVIDLSYAAAESIGLVIAGISKVKVESISDTNQSR